MRNTRLSIHWIPVTALLAVCATVPGLADERPVLQLPATTLDEEQRIVHALNRLGYGPRPGDVEAVRSIGLEPWIAQQLRPESIDDTAVTERLASMRTLRMTQVELLTEYPQPALLRGIARQLERAGRRTPGGMDAAQIDRMFPEVKALEKREKGLMDEEARGEPRDSRTRAQRLLGGPGRIGAELSQAKLLRAIYSERQLQEVMTDFWFNHFNVYIGKGTDRWMTTSYERDAIRPHALGRFRDLLGATAQHPAMLFYLDNWLSSDPHSGFDRIDEQRLAATEIRRMGLPPGGLVTLILRERGVDTGAMEAQLERRDAWLARGGGRGRGTGRPSAQQQAGPQRSGLNENYARELLELHTLGVDGGYTQQDIVEVARCFTGWTLLPPQAGQGFVFVEPLHDQGQRLVLGRKIKGKKMRQGERVLDLLAAHPSTARFVSTKLAVRFVGDDPPAALIDRLAARFTETDGEIRETLLTLFTSEEFWSAETFRSKFKTPLEFVVSAARATDAELADFPTALGDDPGEMRRKAPGLLRVMRDLSQPLYSAQPPTGYPDTAADWVSTGALLNRMKVALGLAGNRVPGVRVRLPDSADLDELGQSLLGLPPSPATLKSIETQLDLGPEEIEELGLPRWFARSDEGRKRLAAGWLLASSEFQRR